MQSVDRYDVEPDIIKEFRYSDVEVVAIQAGIHAVASTAENANKGPAEWHEAAKPEMKFEAHELAAEQQKRVDDLMEKHKHCFTAEDGSDKYGQVIEVHRPAPHQARISCKENEGLQSS